MIRNKEQIRRRTVAAVTRVLKNRNSSKSAKLADGLALSQRRNSSSPTEAAVLKILRNRGSSKSAKVAAGLALGERNRRK